VIYFPPGAPHATRSEVNVKTLQAVMPGPWVDRLAEVAPLTPLVTQHDAGPATWLADRLYREYLQRNAVAPLVLEGILLQMVAEFSRNQRTLNETGGARSVRRAQEFIRAHFADELSIESIAVAAGVHPSHLMRSFRRIQGCTVGDYIRQLRVEEACRMLRSSHEPLAQIACSLGFADQSHFTRTFKAHTGQTPAQFQNSFGAATHVHSRIV
jgi:AraC-like DNA-binding protein